MKRAYLIGDNEVANYYDTIVFAESRGLARAQGPKLMGIDFIETRCRRAPDLDKYAESGFVPTRALVEDHGWCWECAGCETLTCDDDVAVWEDGLPVCHECFESEEGDQ